MLLSRSFVVVSLASIAVATPLQQLHARQNASSPCAQVSASVAAQSAAATPTVAAKVAYDCITSVPFNKTAALALLDSIVPYVRWQSTTAWLKDPPEEYAEKIQPPVDVWGDLDDIKSKAQGGGYANEFEFGWDLYTLFQQTHDGHFVFIPDSVGTVFNWARPIPLVSVSADGKSLPKAFVYPDVLAETLSNASFTSSAISKINGQDSAEFLENWSQYGSLQDRDALYNNVFYNLAAVSISTTSPSIGTFAGSGRGRWVYPGPTTELEFENGTSVTYENFARVLVPFKGITDGDSLYQTYFTAPKPSETEETSATPSNSTVASSSAVATSAAATATSTPAPGYPPPVYREPHNQIGGYYLTDDYSDVAVLSVPSFVSLDAAEIPFQQTAEKFFAAAKAAGKRKLVIDLSINGGGTILQGYDLYKQLFPTKIDHAAGDRFRAFESTDLLGQKQSEIAANYTREIITNGNETLENIEGNIVAGIFNYRTDLNVDGKNFDSWEDKYGPVTIHGDNSSNLIRWNLSDVLTPYNSGGIYVHGYGNLTNLTQPFDAEDVVVVTDGYCASTCTIFSNLLRYRAGVKFVSLGGRPKEGITQAIGGVKGTNDFPWDYIQYLVQLTYALSTTEKQAYYNTTQLNEYWSTTPFDRMAPGTSINVNFRDGYRDDTDYDVPLQFVYEASDCRIYYTKEMTVDVTAIWKAVADSAFGGESHCVAGNLGGNGKRKVKRELTWEDKALAKRMLHWKRGLNAKDYPLDIYTDLRGENIVGNGYMRP